MAKRPAHETSLEEESREAAPGRAMVEAFRVVLPSSREGEPPFEGALDLLLHLVKEHQVDLFERQGERREA